MTYVFGPPSTATPEEKLDMCIVWCATCQRETFGDRPDGCCGWCDRPVEKAAA